MMLILLLVFATVHSKNNCGPGLPVLRRLAVEGGNYEVGYICYCPIDYFGLACRQHRGLNCYLQTQNMTPAVFTGDNFQEVMNLTVTVSAECYIQTNEEEYVPFVSYFASRELGRTDISENL